MNADGLCCVYVGHGTASGRWATDAARLIPLFESLRRCQKKPYALGRVKMNVLSSTYLVIRYILLLLHFINANSQLNINEASKYHKRGP